MLSIVRFFVSILRITSPFRSNRRIIIIYVFKKINRLKIKKIKFFSKNALKKKALCVGGRSLKISTSKKTGSDDLPREYRCRKQIIWRQRQNTGYNRRFDAGLLRDIRYRRPSEAISARIVHRVRGLSTSRRKGGCRGIHRSICKL